MFGCSFVSEGGVTLARAVKESVGVLRKLLKPRCCCCHLLGGILELQLEVAAVNDNEAGDGKDWKEGQNRDSKTRLHPVYQSKLARHCGVPSSLGISVLSAGV